nr:hypothetical protein [Cytophagales bacterium]
MDKVCILQIDCLEIDAYALAYQSLNLGVAYLHLRLIYPIQIEFAPLKELGQYGKIHTAYISKKVDAAKGGKSKKAKG